MGMSADTSQNNPWIFRSLIVISCTLIIWAFTKPFWVCFIDSNIGLIGSVTIYGWGLRTSQGYIIYEIASDITPLYQVVIAWAFIGISCALSIASTFLKGTKGRLLLGTTGAGVCFYSLIAVFVVIRQRLAKDGINLQGESFLEKGMGTTVQANLEIGFYVMLIGAIFLIILAILQKLIVSNTPGKML